MNHAAQMTECFKLFFVFFCFGLSGIDAKGQRSDLILGGCVGKSASDSNCTELFDYYYYYYLEYEYSKSRTYT